MSEHTCQRRSGRSQPNSWKYNCGILNKKYTLNMAVTLQLKLKLNLKLFLQEHSKMTLKMRFDELRPQYELRFTAGGFQTRRHSRRQGPCTVVL